MDFTVTTYQNLINIFKKQNFSFQRINEFIDNHDKRTILLRHDVDIHPKSSLIFAEIENKLGIKGSFYFRATPERTFTRVQAYN